MSRNPKWEKNPGPDWWVGYRFDEADADEAMTVFGQETIEDALREANYSLRGIGGINEGKYRIIGIFLAERLDHIPERIGNA